MVCLDSGILCLGGEDEICKDHGPNYRRNVVRTVSGTYCAFRVAASTDNEPSELSRECAGSLFSNQGGCISLVCELRTYNRHHHRSISHLSSIQRGYGTVASG